MKHAMLMTVHTNLSILKKFIDLFDDERFDFFILSDQKSTIGRDLASIKTKHSKIVLLPPMKIFWGGYSQIEAYLRCLRESSKGNYDYYHFFQGSDFPIKTASETDAFFEQNKGKEFVNIYETDFSFYKCGYYHLFVEFRTYRKNCLLKFANHALVKVQELLGISRNKDLNLRHGSALSSLSHACVSYLLDREADIKKRFRFSLGADEVFLQTYIFNSPFCEKIYRLEDSFSANCRAIDWTRRNHNSPYTYTGKDYEDLICLGEDILFCRKVTEECSADLVDDLYRYLKEKTI